jgi:hypothetical protein
MEIRCGSSKRRWTKKKKKKNKLNEDSEEEMKYELRRIFAWNGSNLIEGL